MKKFSKVICCFAVVMLLCGMTTQVACADDNSYSVTGGKFSQGIEM